ncbi:hypothetical protein ACJIZ3_016384 [Penstemon smallii]|uniref:Transmembrane protein n=1 Tax=Penstemon smallii TaxID=265156 RepID=A0ABD3RT96_9LAMI
MIYRKWSLLTGPATILGGIIGTIVVVDLLFIENVLDDCCVVRWIPFKDWLRKTDQTKKEYVPSTKKE